MNRRDLLRRLAGTAAITPLVAAEFLALKSAPPAPPPPAPPVPEPRNHRLSIRPAVSASWHTGAWTTATVFMLSPRFPVSDYTVPLYEADS